MSANEDGDRELAERAARQILRSIRLMRQDPSIRPLLDLPLRAGGGTNRPATVVIAAPGGYEFGRLMTALDSFPTVVGYLNGRRPSTSGKQVKSEADVQDILFTILKPMFPTLVFEQPTEKGAVGYSIGDFALAELELIIEAKYIDSRGDVKKVADEIAEDIWKYSNQTTCERIVFFVYDPGLLIPDRESFKQVYTAGDYRVRGRTIDISTVIKP